MNAVKNTQPTLLVIVGPTGSGKSNLAVRLAMHLGAPIFSTDSRQVYKGMAIGTAQPTEEQQLAVPHYFIADREPTERFTCADFEREALVLLEKLFKSHECVVAVGGSGLYIDALCDGIDPVPDINPELRNTLNAKLLQEGLEPLLKMLREKDPAYYQVVDRHNPARVLRALEVCLETGRPFSEMRSGESLRKGAKTRAEHTSRPFRIVKIGIDLPRPELYDRIDARVDAMIEAGLEAEARKLHHINHLPALQTVGYSEFFDHFDGLYTEPGINPGDGRDGYPSPPLPPEKSLARAVELIKRNSRRYAKRQMTWFRRDPNIHWISPDEPPENIFSLFDADF